MGDGGGGHRCRNGSTHPAVPLPHASESQLGSDSDAAAEPTCWKLMGTSPNRSGNEKAQTRLSTANIHRHNTGAAVQIGCLLDGQQHLKRSLDLVRRCRLHSNWHVRDVDLRLCYIRRSHALCERGNGFATTMDDIKCMLDSRCCFAYLYAFSEEGKCNTQWSVSPL